MPSQISQAFLTKSSGLICFVLGSGVSNALVYVNGVNSNPTVNVNYAGYNGAVNLGTGIYSPSNSYVLYNLGSSVPYYASLTYNAPSSWVNTSAGPGLSQIGVVNNYAGVGPIPNVSSTMKVGLNTIDPPGGSYGNQLWPMKNSMIQSWNWANTILDSGGRPISFLYNNKGDFALQASQLSSTYSGTYLPAMTGEWKFIWDDVLNSGSNFIIDSPYSTLSYSSSGTQNGIMVTGVQRNYIVTNPYPIVYGNLNLANNAGFNGQCQYSGPYGGAPQFQNLWCIAPNNTPDRSHPLAIDQNFINYLSNSNGQPNCAVFRWMDSQYYGGTSEEVLPRDIPATGNFNLIRPSGYVCNVLAVQPYNYLTGSGIYIPAVNQYVKYTSSPLGAYGQNWYMAEFITSGNHPFQTGYSLTCNSNVSVPIVYNGTGVSYLYPLGSNRTCYVTSPSSILAIDYISNNANTVGGNVSGYHAYSSPTTLTFSFTDGRFPYEYQALATAAISGCDYWISIGATYNNDAVTQIAKSILSTIPPDRKVYVEYTNEHWNYGLSQYFFCRALGLALYPSGYPDFQDCFYAQRANQIHNIFKAVFASGSYDRSQQIQRIFLDQQGYYGGLAGTIQALAYYNIPADAFGTAPYWTNVSDGNTLIAYANWTPDQINEMIQCGFLYSALFASYPQWNANNAAYYNNAVSGNMRTVNYEGNIQNIIPGNFSNNTAIMHDVFYSPSYYDSKKAYLYALQQNGIQEIAIYGLMGNGWYGQVGWQSLRYAGQGWGRGDGTDGTYNTLQYNSSQPSGVYDGVNVSTDMQAIKDWWKASAPNSGYQYPTPYIQSSSPYNNQVGIFPDQSISATFNIPVNSSVLQFSLSSGSGNSGGFSSVFNLSAFNTVPFNAASAGNTAYTGGFNFSYNQANNTATWQPKVKLFENKSYIGTVSNIVDVQYGISGVTTSINFSTIPTAYLFAYFPSNLSTIDVSSNPNANFSSPINITGANFLVYNGNAYVPNLTIVSGTSVIFEQTYPFNFSTNYNATISGVKDYYTGQTIPQFNWSFQTSASHNGTGGGSINPFSITISNSDLRYYGGIQINFV